MASSFKEEMSPDPSHLSDQLSDGPSDQEMLSDPNHSSEAEMQVVRLNTHGPKGPFTVRLKFDDAEAEYDEHTGKYVIHATFLSEQPFAMKNQTVRKHRYGQKRKFGTVFFEGKHAGPFRFLDLPAEIRVMIYELVLCAPPCKNGKWKDGKPIVENSDEEAWDVDVDKAKAITTSSVEESTYHPELHIQRVRWKPRTKYPFQDGRMNLLLVSKQVNLEASDTLYGTTIFRFDDTNTLQGFRLLIGHNRRYLQRVRLIGQMAHASLRPACQLLTEATRLQFLQIKFTQYGLFRLFVFGRESVFEAFRPLFDMFFARDLDYSSVLDNRVVIRTITTCYCGKSGFFVNRECVVCRYETEISGLEQSYFGEILKYWVKYRVKLQEQERKKAEAEAKSARRQKPRPNKSKQASKSKKRSREEFDDDDDADNPDASALTLPAPEPARKMPGRRAKSMGSYEAQLADDEEDIE
ncbi:hypothetical protein MBLNU457_3797t1 [Dothideomycetes sp. NU457]